MAVRETQSMNARKLAEEFKAVYSESLRDAISDVSLAPLLIESSFFAIRNASDQELFFATSNYLDEYLLSAVPPTVTFAEDRLTFWAMDALEFTRKNVSHSSFTEIFSSRLQYEPAIQELLQFDETGRFLGEYFKELRINSVYFGEALPRSFRAAVETAAKSAVQPALRNSAIYLKNFGNLGRSHSRAKLKKVSDVRTSFSFLNGGGTIPFSESSGKFKIQPSSELKQIAQYRPVVNRALRKLIEARTFQRIDNRDGDLASLLSEYNTEISRSAD